MLTQIALLRGINLGSHNRIAMPALREALGDAGLDDVRTYVQSGNVVLRSALSEDELRERCERTIAERFDLRIAVVTRTREELAAVVERNPLAAAAADPKRYQVSFLSAAPDPEVLARIAGLAVEPERIEAVGRELYTWHPEGIGRSKMWGKLAGTGLGVTATARNWTTVTTLLAMAAE